MNEENEKNLENLENLETNIRDIEIEDLTIIYQTQGLI